MVYLWLDVRLACRPLPSALRVFAELYHHKKLFQDVYQQTILLTSVESRGDSESRTPDLESSAVDDLNIFSGADGHKTGIAPLRLPRLYPGPLQVLVTCT